MANPQPFKEQNLLLGAGGNPNTSDMPVSIAKDAEGIPFIVSNWKFTPEELKLLNENNGSFFVCVMGTSTPPVMATAYNPFTMFGFEAVEL